MKIELNNKEVEILKVLLSLDMGRIGFEKDEQKIIVDIYNKLKPNLELSYTTVCNYIEKTLHKRDDSGKYVFPRVPGGFPNKETLTSDARDYFKDKDIIDFGEKSDLEDCLSDAYNEIKNEYLEFFED